MSSAPTVTEILALSLVNGESANRRDDGQPGRVGDCAWITAYSEVMLPLLGQTLSNFRMGDDTPGMRQAQAPLLVERVLRLT